MYFLKSMGLELLYWILGQVEGVLWIVIITIYLILLTFIGTSFPMPYAAFIGAVGGIIGLILAMMYPLNISTWTLVKKEQLKKERDRLRQITNK